MVWYHFQEEAARYYAALDKYFYTGRKQASELSKKTKLSQKILKKISELQLNSQQLRATLRSWQDFGAKYALLQKKVLIGDVMGLGKTLIAIAVMAHLAEEGKQHFLVICPSSIMENWSREVKKHSTLNPVHLHGTKVNREAALSNWKEKGGVGITTYETAIKLNFSDAVIDVLAVDEAHYAKNPEAKRSKNVYALSEKSPYTIFLTGTPLENRTSEMTALIYALQPEIAHTIRNPKVHNRPEVYRREIAPVYLRRSKEDVRLELPPLNQVEEWEEFGKKEFKVYKEAVADGNFMLMRRAAWSGGSVSESPKLERLKEICEEAAINHQKVIVFSFFKSVLTTVEAALSNKAIGVINGDVPIARRQELIDEFKSSSNKNVIVAQITTAAHGLNMQFANIIIFCEPQLKPSLENQAVARAYRMGQTQSVFVYRLLTPDSIDELMMDMLSSKQKLFDAYADKSYLYEEASQQDVMTQVPEEHMKQKSFFSNKTVLEWERKKNFNNKRNGSLFP
ncbi:DEAD/DEAH box helicase [Jeotgalibaca caeni]|uniref:DEAD/DEAH box helicase n=1 Tax=Jeotgalibaca caeni TaxID=3028623 RepID=UPI00237ED6C4|nr:DEAD/DEAH box helicase [Jeotgalibaca caeni]MDE1549975.1 DEAD/DEAH box helicase [Jeotgalibaca caeni]